MLHRIAWLLAKLLYRLRIFGLEHLPATGPAPIVSNHVSYVDWLFLMAASPRPIRFVVARNFFSKPFVGWWLRRVARFRSPDGLGPIHCGRLSTKSTQR